MVLSGVVSAVTIRPILKEPLLHFLLAGAGLFLITSLSQGWVEDGERIAIDKEDLLVFMQDRAQVYDEATFNALLEDMPEDQRRQLVRDTALQEALYREGTSLGLAEADPLIRQRVVQQMRLLLMEEAASDMAVSDGEVRAYYTRNKDIYALPPQISFTHVFIPDKTAAGRRQADTLLLRLRTGKVPAEDAGQYGERFLYQLNYAEASRDLVASHFGNEFATAVFGLGTGVWSGPVDSDYGRHLVLPGRVDQAKEPDFESVADRVREDALAEKRQLAADKALDAMLLRYHIVVDEGTDG